MDNQNKKIVQKYKAIFSEIDWITWMHRLIIIIAAIFINAAFQLSFTSFNGVKTTAIQSFAIFLNVIAFISVLVLSFYFSTSIKTKTVLKFLAGYVVYLVVSYFVIVTRNLNNNKFKFWSLEKNDFFQFNAVVPIGIVIVLSIILKFVMNKFRPEKLNFIYTIFEDYKSDRSYLSLFFAILISNHSQVLEALYSSMGNLIKLKKIGEFETSFFITSAIVLVILLAVGFWITQGWEDIRKNRASVSLALTTSIFSAVVLNYTLQFGVKDSGQLLGYYIMPGATLFQIVMLSVLLFIPYLIFNRYLPSVLVDIVLGTTISIVNILKNNMRNEPLLVTDFSWLSHVDFLLTLINLKLIIIITIIFVIPIMLYILLRHKLVIGQIYDKISIRIVSALLVLLFMIGVFSTFSAAKDNKVISNIPVISKLNNSYNIEWMGFDVNARYKSVIYVWTRQLTTTVMKKPSNYSKSTMGKLVKKYESRAKEINKTRDQNISDQTVIYILNESFSDPTRVPNVSLSQDIIPKVKGIKNSTTSGLMKSDGYGGGTANMEFQTLTGLPYYNYSSSVSTLYTEVVPKMQYFPSISNAFASKNRYVMHPSGAFNYNRKGIYSELDFKHLIFDTDGNEKFKNSKKVGVSVSDKTVFDNVLDKIENKDNQFFSVITMQNHVPWSVGKPEDITGRGKGFNSQANGSLTEYARLLHYSDDSVDDFLKSLSKLDKKVTVVFYGDHLPGLYPTSTFKSDPDSQYQTDYFIWSNKDNKKMNYPLVNSSDFTAELLEQTDSKVTPYYALLTDVLHNASVDKKGLTKEQQKIANDLKLVQYDISVGKDYINNKAFFEY